jgi:hypothetical protein
MSRTLVILLGAAAASSILVLTGSGIGVPVGDVVERETADEERSPFVAASGEGGPGSGSLVEPDAVPAPARPRAPKEGDPAAAGPRLPSRAPVPVAAPAGDHERARTHPHLYVGGNPWWPRHGGAAANGVVAGDPNAPPVRHGDPSVVLEDDGVHHRATDDVERRPWLDAQDASGDDHAYGRTPRPPAEGPQALPEPPAAKEPEARIGIQLTVRTNVTGAVVRANGYRVGDEPLEMRLRPPGDLEVVATAPGYATAVRSIRLGRNHAGGPVEVTLDLQPDLPGNEVPEEGDVQPAPRQGGR